MTKRTIFLTGATGRIGRILLKDLLKGDHRLIVLAYNGEEVDTSDPRVEYIFGNILEPSTYIPALKSADIVVHMAAITHTNEARKYYDINAGATADLVKYSKEFGIKRFIFISTRAISEKGGHYSRSKIMAEKYVKEGGVGWVILRLAEVYGIGGEAGVNMVINNTEKLPFIPIIGDGRYRLAPVHISDVLYSIERVIRDESVIDKTYNIAGPESFSYNDLVDKILKIKNLKKIQVHIPIWVVRILSYILSVLPGTKLFVIDQLPRFLCDKDDDISLAARELDFKPVHITERLGG